MIRHRIKSAQLHRWPALLIISAAALFLFFEAVRHDCWTDEGFTMRRIGTSWDRLYNPLPPAFAAQADPFDRRFTIDYNPPLYYALLRAILGADPSLLAVRAASIAGFFIGMAGLHFWSRRALGLRSQTFMLFLCFISPAMIFYGHEARPYMLPIALATVCFGLIWSQAAHPVRLFGICLVFSLLGCLMNFHIAWLVITLACCMCVFVIKPDRRFGRSCALAGIGGLVVGSALAVLAIVPQWNTILQAADAYTDALSVLTAIRLVVLPVAGPFTTTIPRLQPIALGLYVSSFIPMAILILYGLRRLPRSSRKTAGWMSLALWLGPLVLIVIAHVLLGSPITVRYAMISLPGWLMFATWIAREIGVDNTNWHRTPSAALAGLILISLVMDVFMLAHPTRQVWKPAIREFKEQCAATDYYAFDPDEIKYAFAVNAAAPPRARYFCLPAGLPKTQDSIWLFALKTPSPQTFEMFDKNGWLLTSRINGSITLLKAEKKH